MTRGSKTVGVLAIVVLAILAIVWRASTIQSPLVSTASGAPDVEEAAALLDAPSGTLAPAANAAVEADVRMSPAPSDCSVQTRRWPDRKPLAEQSVTVHGPDGATDELTTDASGALLLTGVRVGDRRRLELERFEPVDFVVPEPREELVVVDCMPTFGLWGRVRTATDAPVADARVEIASVSFRVGVDRPQLETAVSAQSVQAARERGDFTGFPEVHLALRPARLDRTRTSADGWYYLAVDHERADFTELTVEKPGAARGELDVELPRDGHELPDVVLREGEATLRVRVASASGQAVVGASVHAVFFTGEPGVLGTSYEDGPSARTDENGCAVLPRFDRGALLRVRKQGLASIGTRDRPSASNESIAIEPHVMDVEIVMEELPGFAVRLVDRATGEAVRNGDGAIHLAVPSSDDAAPEPLDLAFDAQGRARAWIPRAFGARVRVHAWAQSYLAVDELHDVPTVGAESQDLVLVLDRDGSVPAAQPIRGIVLLHGMPAPKARVVASVWTQFPRGPEYSTAWSGTADEDGRFLLDTSSLRGAERVLFQARTAKLAELGVTRSMPVADSTRSDVRVELESTIAVPITVIGAPPGCELRAHLSLWDGDARIRIAANGVDVDASSSFVRVNVPAGRRATISAQCKLGPAGWKSCGDEIEIDPALPLVEHRLTIDVPAVALWTVTGRAASFETDADAELYVALGRIGAESHAAARVNAAGEFRFSGIEPGEYQLRLVRANSSTWVNVLARRAITVDRDVTGVVLAPDVAARAK